MCRRHILHESSSITRDKWVDSTHLGMVEMEAFAVVEVMKMWRIWMGGSPTDFNKR